MFLCLFPFTALHLPIFIEKNRAFIFLTEDRVYGAITLRGGIFG